MVAAKKWRLMDVTVVKIGIILSLLVFILGILGGGAALFMSLSDGYSPTSTT